MASKKKHAERSQRSYKNKEYMKDSFFDKLRWKAYLRSLAKADNV